MPELNDIGIGFVILMIGLDVWMTYKIYDNEYKENKGDNKGV